MISLSILIAILFTILYFLLISNYRIKKHNKGIKSQDKVCIKSSKERKGSRVKRKL